MFKCKYLIFKYLLKNVYDFIFKKGCIREFENERI